MSYWLNGKNVSIAEQCQLMWRLNRAIAHSAKINWLLSCRCRPKKQS